MFKKILEFFRSSPKKEIEKKRTTKKSVKPVRKIEPARIGELGEHKINIQLDQLPKDCKYLSDILIANSKSKTGYSQVDHLVITPYGLFVIETKNYNGEIKGNKNDRYWSVSNRFKMYNPFFQNYGHIKALEYILHEFKTLTFVSMISFTMRCRFSVDPELRKIHSNDLIVYDVELTEFIQRKLLRFKAESPEPKHNEIAINRIYEIIQKANIVDPIIRNEHIERAKISSGK
ncbi:nuclease-related domain-containing protein [Paenibacillus sp. Soil787]|uniref:nuclease-related domain-containing protein n=1 Tax=Paenibacillus sp. Soil787 TaxID=1736411 RepID=UPI0006F86C11|nr:nuclease-related domain-containing protein [Paenibacillus sp. Soil787]KRF39888.1 NERD nuclease [Paenibacillus sp. Soil787]